MNKFTQDFVNKFELDNVIILGSLEFSELVVYYNVCDLGLSLYKDGSPVIIPVKIYDYLAAGLPIINSLRGELEHLLKENHAGVNYKSGDKFSLANTVLSLSDNPSGRKAMADNAKSLSIEFLRSKQYKKFLTILNQLGF